MRLICPSETGVDYSQEQAAVTRNPASGSIAIVPSVPAKAPSLQRLPCKGSDYDAGRLGMRIVTAASATADRVIVSFDPNPPSEHL